MTSSSGTDDASGLTGRRRASRPPAQGDSAGDSSWADVVGVRGSWQDDDPGKNDPPGGFDAFGTKDAPAPDPGQVSAGPASAGQVFTGQGARRSGRRDQAAAEQSEAGAAASGAPGSANPNRPWWAGGGGEQGGPAHTSSPFQPGSAMSGSPMSGGYLMGGSMGATAADAASDIASEADDPAAGRESEFSRGGFFGSVQPPTDRPSYEAAPYDPSGYQSTHSVDRPVYTPPPYPAYEPPTYEPAYEPTFEAPAFDPPAFEAPEFQTSAFQATPSFDPPAPAPRLPAPWDPLTSAMSLDELTTALPAIPAAPVPPVPPVPSAPIIPAPPSTDVGLPKRPVRARDQGEETTIRAAAPWREDTTAKDAETAEDIARAAGAEAVEETATPGQAETPFNDMLTGSMPTVGRGQRPRAPGGRRPDRGGPRRPSAPKVPITPPAPVLPAAELATAFGDRLAAERPAAGDVRNDVEEYDDNTMMFPVVGRGAVAPEHDVTDRDATGRDDERDDDFGRDDDHEDPSRRPHNMLLPGVPGPAPVTSRAGRNLPAAIAVGVGLGALAVVSLFSRPEAFVALVSVVAVLAVWELAGAMAAKDIMVPVVPLAVGSLGMLVSAFVAGEEGLLVSFTLTGFGVLLWRIIDGVEGAARDVTAGLFVTAYVPLLAGFAVLMLADGPKYVVAFILVTVASDIGGYVAGVLAGKHPMAPSISPKKTWEGFAGSVVACLGVGVAAVVLLLDGPPLVGLALGAAAVVTATLGDLAESLLKRDLNVKDMGNLLPGHGGFMDRLDSLLPTAPVAFLILHMLVATR